MSSDSELSATLPDDDTIESALRQAVSDAHAAGELEELSVNSVRTAAEKELGFDAGFFKSDAKWKSLSKSIISDAADAARDAPPSPASKPRQTARSGAKASVSKKRKVAATEKPRKRRKEASKDDDTAESASDDAGNEVEAVSEQNIANNDSDSSKLSEPSAEESGEDKSVSKVEGPEASESELSDVKDEAPPKRRAKRSSNGDKASKSAKPKKTKASSKAAKDSDLSPDEQEIKKLQGWLLKCGIRKLWHRELAACDSSKAKIKHLKSMLEDVGMTGRYSLEKANAIKEQRELAADLEAVQEGNKTWGMESGSEKENSDSASKPARRRGVASRFVDFGDDEDDE